MCRVFWGVVVPCYFDSPTVLALCGLLPYREAGV